MKTYDERSKDVSARIKKHKRQKKTVTAVCLTAVMAILAVVLLVPYSTEPPSVKPYENSPYFDLIQKINAANFDPPTEYNRLDTMLSGAEELISMNSGSDAAAPETNGSTSADFADSDYVEVTDNQVAGVIEADIIKRSTEFIYYLRGDQLTVYSIAGEDSKLVGEYAAEDISGYCNSMEMYLSADCTTVTLVLDAYDETVGSCAILINLDVTDPANITEIGRVYLSGSYLSSRVVDGDLLLMSKYRVSSNCDFDDESTFVPQVGQPEDMASIEPADIIYPDELSSTQYTVICKVDGASLEILDTAAFLSYSDEIYVSQNNIFATRGYEEHTDEGYFAMTEISCLNYSGDTLEHLGSAIVEGTVKDQYSMDEYDGILRIVTSVDNTIVEYSGETVSGSWERNANLYCIDLSDFSIAASVECFAPDGEQAESVRFDGPMAYVCTAEIITLTDPVYFFDLSDLDNITWTDTGTIDGYSSSLVNFGEYLLGIGYNGSMELKIEVYEEISGAVESVCAYERRCSFSEEYKSYFIDREKNLVGLGIYDWDDGEGQYILLHFDGYELNEILNVPISGDLEDVRAVLIDGWLYIFSDEFAVEHLW